MEGIRDGSTTDERHARHDALLVRRGSSVIMRGKGRRTTLSNKSSALPAVNVWEWPRSSAHRSSHIPARLRPSTVWSTKSPSARRCPISPIPTSTSRTCSTRHAMRRRVTLHRSSVNSAWLGARRPRVEGRAQRREAYGKTHTGVTDPGVAFVDAAPSRDHAPRALPRVGSTWNRVVMRVRWLPVHAPPSAALAHLLRSSNESHGSRDEFSATRLEAGR